MVQLSYLLLNIIALTVTSCVGFSDFEKDVKVIIDEKGTDYYLVPLDMLEEVRIKRETKKLTQNEKNAIKLKETSIVSRLINKLEKAQTDVSNDEFHSYRIAGGDANITLTRRTRDDGAPSQGCVHGDPFIYTF